MPTEEQANAFAVTVLGAPSSLFPAQSSPVPPTQGPGASLVGNAAFEAMVETMEADGEDEVETWKTQTTDTVFKLLPPHLHAEYDADGRACDLARDGFVVAWNQVTFGKGDLAALEAAYEQFSLRIGALEHSNARVAALIEVDLAEKLQFLVALLLQLSKAALAWQMSERLRKLSAALAKAADEVSDAKIKMGLNLAASAITMVINPEATLGKLALSIASVGVHVAIDDSLGSGTTSGKVVFVVGESGEAVEAFGEHATGVLHNLDKVGKKSFGTAGAAITALLDYREVGEAKERVAELKARIEEEQKAYDSLMAGVLPLIPRLQAAAQALVKLKGEIQQAMGRAGDAKATYEAIKTEIVKAKSGRP